MFHNSKNKGIYKPDYGADLKPIGLEVYQSDIKVRFQVTKGRPVTNKRSNVTHFTRKSRRRLAFVAANTPVDFVSLITLTYPNIFPTDGVKVKRDLNLILTRFRQRWGKIEYLWFLEFQKRGAPHVHILIDVATSKGEQEWLSQAWYDVVDSGDQKHLLAGTQFSPVRKPNGARRYAVKYAMKMRQKEVPEVYQNVGRFWSHSKGVKPEQIGETIPIDSYEDYKHYLQRWEYYDKIEKPMGILYNASVALAEQVLIDKGYSVD